MIQKLSFMMENCYGINRLVHAFSFSQKKRVYSIYAPNGTMKTSFAKSLSDYSKNIETSDKIYPKRITKREIYYDENIALDPEKIFVIETLNENYTSENISTLMVNHDLKNEYEDIHKDIDKKKATLFKELQNQSKLTKNTNIENILCEVFEVKDIYDFISNIQPIIAKEERFTYSDIDYKIIFNDKSIEFLIRKDVIEQIENYIHKYDELIEQSKIFKKGFNHYNAKTIHKSLKDNGFFSARHSLNLFNGENLEKIENEIDLENIIEKEINTVLSNPELKNHFDKIDKSLSNTQLRTLREYLEENQDIITELSDIRRFQKKVWLSYITKFKELFLDLFEEYNKGKIRINEIVENAKKQRTKWESVVKIFNERFSLPFKLKVENQCDAVLQKERPSFKYIYTNREEEQEIEKNALMKILSMGEKRALYILNIIFEIEVRKETISDSLLIFDDIADSFDYKNKYAIIQYLHDISMKSDFCMIILTHNFDFHRTISSRLDLDRCNKIMAVKSEYQIELVEEKYQKNPFEYWKTKFIREKKYFIAMIPFVRNIAEYCGKCNEYNKLTSLFHIKSDTLEICYNEVLDIYSEVINITFDKEEKNDTITLYKTIIDVAEQISSNPSNSIDLENKIILSIAIRLIAENLMITDLNDSDFVNGITKNQTHELIKKYKDTFPSNNDVIDLLECVSIITPENIHVNSFMYEPILDMDIHHLVRLYKDLVKINK